MSAETMDHLARDAHHGRGLASGNCESIDEFALRERTGIGNVEGVANGRGLVNHLETHAHEVVDVNELHQSPAIPWHDDRAVGAQTIPKEGLAIKRVARPIDERRPKGYSGKSQTLMQPEQRAL